jgi:hypothetical protein
MKLLLALTFFLLLTACSHVPESKPEVNSIPELEPWAPLCQELESKIGTSRDGSVSFENVSFAFDRTQISQVDYFVSPECRLESDDIKPDAIGARTLHFQLHYENSTEKAHITVFKIQEYKNAFTRYPQYIEHRDRELTTLLGSQSSLKTFGPDAPPHVRWMDAGHVFYAKARKVSFVNGNGLLIVTQITQDAFSTVANRTLEYFYQGFTEDGEYFVEMNFPVDLRGLPEEVEMFPSEQSNVSYKYNSSEHSRVYERYVLQTAQRIDQASNNDFEPGLDETEKFIQGFQVK